MSSVGPTRVDDDDVIKLEESSEDCVSEKCTRP